MNITFNGFGSIRDITGFTLSISKASISVEELRNILINNIKQKELYAFLVKNLDYVAFATDEKILNDMDILDKDCTINLLPPVCGG